MRHHAIAYAMVLTLAFSPGASGSSTPDDPFFAEPEASNPDPNNHLAYQWPLGAHRYGDRADIGALGAWDFILGHAYLGSLDAGIAEWTDTGQSLLTSGLQVGPIHPDLIANFREHLSPSFGDALRAQDNSDRVYGHGMHVMGVMAGRSDNGQGIAGVCWQCSTMLSNIGIGLEDDVIAPRFDELVRSGVQAINISFGGLAPAWRFDLDPLIDGIATNRDIVVVAAAGNDRRGFVDTPARKANVIGVGGSGLDGRRWDDSGGCVQLNMVDFECGSNWGAGLDLVAPAKSVLSSWYPGNDFEGTTAALCGDALHAPGAVPGPIHPDAAVDDGYGLCTGTSMSTPFVTGVVGLVRSANPLLSRTAVHEILGTTARNPFGDTDIGDGLIDARAAVERALGTVAGATLRNRLTPLFQLYSTAARDHLATTVPQMAASAIQGDPRRRYSSTNPAAPAPMVQYASRAGVEAVGRYPAFPDGAGQTPRAWVHVFTGERDPHTGDRTLAPLYRLSFIDSIAGNPAHRDHTYATGAAEVATFEAAGFRLDGIEGYIYPASEPQPIGTIGLWRRFSPTRGDHIIFPEDRTSTVAAEGYTSGSQLLGYVYRTIDSDGDGVIDGFEDLIGTDPLVADSDGDGSGDGQEILDHPYTDPRGDWTCAPIHASSFNSGDTSEWSQAVTTGTGTLSVSSANAISAPFGLSARVQGANDKAYLLDTSPIVETHYLAQFDLKVVSGLLPNEMPNGAVHRIFAGYDAWSNLFALVIDFRRNGDFFEIRARAYQDDATWASAPWERVAGYTEKQPLPHRVEVEIDTEAGTLRFQVDNTSHQLTGLDLTTRRIDEARLGHVNSVDNLVDVNLVFDNFDSCR